MTMKLFRSVQGSGIVFQIECGEFKSHSSPWKFPFGSLQLAMIPFLKMLQYHSRRVENEIITLSDRFLESQLPVTKLYPSLHT